ncbi:hypothetical protein TNCV_3621631 [Trichonephila clavipes]|nr:hypothetical protein TNCV_3621631 [Trichonephila clavipes]
MVVKDRVASSRHLAASWSTATGPRWPHSCKTICRRTLPSGLCFRTPRVMGRGAISYHRRSNLLRIDINLNSNSPTHAISSLPTYSPDMSTIEHVWNFDGRRLAAHPCPAASEDELLLSIQEIWNSHQEA